MHSVYPKGPEQCCQTFVFGPQIRPRSLLTMLLWLPVEQPRIEFCLCFASKIVSDQTLIYFSDFPQLYTPSRQLHLLRVLARVFRIPPFRTKSSGQRSFFVYCVYFYFFYFFCLAAATWNQLPVSVRFFQIFLQNHNLYKNHFFSPIAPWCVCVCVCVRACVRACVCVSMCMCLFI